MPEMPEWVHVWGWLRFNRELVVAMPQQKIEDSITVDEYELFREEWLGIGAPRMTPRGLVAAMSGERLKDPVPF